MIVMNRQMRRNLDLSIREHAQAMYDWGNTQDNADLKKVKLAWKRLNALIDEPTRNKIKTGV